jgi:hypothetical protein
MVLLLPVDEIWLGNETLAKGGGSEVERVELVGIREWKRVQQDAIDHGKKSGVRADAQGESEDGDGCEAGIFQEYTHTIANILPEGQHGAPPFT